MTTVTNTARHQRRIDIQTLRAEILKARARREEARAEAEFLTNKITQLESELRAAEARRDDR